MSTTTTMIEPDDAYDDYLRPVSEKSTDEEIFLDSQETNSLVSVPLENLFNEEENRSNKSTEQFLSPTNSRIDDHERIISKESEFSLDHQQETTPSSVGTFYIPEETEINENEINASPIDEESQYLQELFGADQLVPEIVSLSSGETSQSSTSNSTSSPIDMASGEPCIHCSDPHDS